MDKESLDILGDLATGIIGFLAVITVVMYHMEDKKTIMIFLLVCALVYQASARRD